MSSDSYASVTLPGMHKTAIYEIFANSKKKPRFSKTFEEWDKEWEESKARRKREEEKEFGGDPDET